MRILRWVVVNLAILVGVVVAYFVVVFLVPWPAAIEGPIGHDSAIRLSAGVGSILIWLAAMLPFALVYLALLAFLGRWLSMPRQRMLALLLSPLPAALLLVSVVREAGDYTPLFTASVVIPTVVFAMLVRLPPPPRRRDSGGTSADRRADEWTPPSPSTRAGL
jgi:hypothetical protein